MTEILEINQNDNNNDTEMETLEGERAQIIRDAIATRTINLVTTRTENKPSVMPEEFTD